MRLIISITTLGFLCIWHSFAKAMEPEEYIYKAASALANGNLSIFSPAIRNNSQIRKFKSLVRKAGPIEHFEYIDDVELHTGELVQGRTIHSSSIIYWTIGYSNQTQLIETLEMNVAPRNSKTYSKAKAKIGKKGKDGGGREGTERLAKTGMKIDRIPDTQTDVCQKYPVLCTEKDQDVRIVEFLFATTREATSSNTNKVQFSGSRAKDLTLGAARVRIPEKHDIGRIELPKKLNFWGYTVYEAKLDEKKHFAIRSVVKLNKDEWGSIVQEKSSKEALVFIHGYNTSFEDALYSNAQILWDIQYKRGTSILFTWASKGQMIDYVYDQQSALLARSAFLDLLRILRDEFGIEKINVLAHSMGNLIVLDALANAEKTKNPLRISELILAAPDVDRDYFLQVAANVRKITDGMTLYCSAADKAMTGSRQLAKVPRAGDVPPEGPILIPDIETIDVTAMGQEILGINHDVFASNRSVMNDVKAILNGLHPPDARGEARRVPEGSDRPKYWRYPN